MQILPHPYKDSLISSAPRMVPDQNRSAKPFNLPTPVPGKPPPQPRSQQRADLSNLQPADLTTSLMVTVARLRSEVYSLKFAHQFLRRRPRGPSRAQPRPTSFTTTKVPKFSESTSWDQYKIFDAIVNSNGWDDATVALQLLCHLEGDTLNVALSVPESTRVTQISLVEALTDHNGSPGRLADYRRQFERTVRQDGEDP